MGHGIRAQAVKRLLDSLVPSGCGIVATLPSIFDGYQNVLSYISRIETQSEASGGRA